ncbi:MAG TPA: hypothetical protein VMW72_03205 [Sedimentisphaerales bacterium]|nr:hypothetical protein [Sedimentisphaerales bacterium]
MNPTDQIERTIERLHITTRAGTDKRILEDAFAALEQSTQKQPPQIGRSARRRTLRIRIAELAAVAAVILVVFALFFGTRATKALGLGEIYEALGRVENVCIATFQPPANEPVQTEWVSQSLNIDMVRFGERFVLWDIPNRVRMTRYLSSDSVKTEMLSDEILAKVEQAASRRFGLVPFSDISDVSRARWSRVEDPRLAAVVSGSKVYELTWPQKEAGSETIEFRKWRVFVDTRTKLPKRAEHYFKFEPGEDYKFEKYEVITYPSEGEIQAVVHETFVPAASRPGEPEYIGTPQPN